LSLERETDLSIGRVLSSSTTRLVAGCPALLREVPNFGALVKVQVPNGTEVYGLIYDVAYQDDLLVRQLIGAEAISEVVLRDQRENRQIPIEVGVLVVGYRRDGVVYQVLPPQPPPALNEVWLCGDEEILAFSRSFDYFRTVLASGDLPADELLAASLRQASRCREGEGATRAYLVQAGRELVGLLNDDLARLEGILRRIRA